MSRAALPDVLQRIVARRRERLGAQQPPVPEAPAAPPAPEAPREHSPFVRALREAATTAIIAEVKLGSPKLGDLRSRVDPERQAESYARAGAAALSVVVEPDFFYGSYELLARCKRASGLPAVAKDFVVHPRQLDAAQEAGADAVLLIAALYDAEELSRWAQAARSLGLVPLIETHEASDSEKLRGSSWELVGVNNRDLRTFRVDLGHSIAMASRLPPEALLVAESGIASRADIERLAAAGFGAFLVGETLLLAADPKARLAELIGDGGARAETRS